MHLRNLSAMLVLPVALASAAWTQPTSPSQSGPPMMGRGMGPGMMGRGMTGCCMSGSMTGSMVRHHQAMMGGIPEPYRSARNPLPNTAATLKRGAEVYVQNCASCHGSRGYGDGPAGQQLSPHPADLNWLARSRMVGDQYVYWTVSVGGKPVGSAMPAFEGALPSKDIWAVVAYVRNGVDAGRR